ncbi:tetratricopeptide repeat protein [Halomicronema sp. CCY15110]|uniref:tetratricopeptide repeat protein n=1 Tax=Halomicronema sp. CCY15110 TaxID=2767773 RepID=UPI00194E2486|nr:tetratricopeptide repeat protein [Halomicronema sp. CCY15110]
MSNQRFTALIQALILTLGTVVAITQPVQGHTGSQPPAGAGEHLQANILDFIFPNRKKRTRGSRRSTRPVLYVGLPYVLSPRNTAVFDTEALTLQWQPIEGATSYTVEINGNGIDWQEEVTGTEATFDELESLVPNRRYTIVVMTDSGISSESDNVGFQLLPETERDRVNAQIDTIKSAQWDADEEALEIALQYLNFEHSDSGWRSYALNQAAIDVLEIRIQAGTEDSRVYLLQADTYLRIGLPLLARERYEKALTYAEAAGQLELQAESYWGLGDVAQGQTEYEDALAHLQMSQAFYEDLSDHEMAEALQIQIEKLPIAQ